MPVSIEQAEGPKKVKSCFENPLKKPELVNMPHWYELPVLKLQCPRVIGSEGLHELHEGNDGGVWDVMVSPTPVVIESTLAPSKLYSFAHLVFCNNTIASSKNRKVARYRFTSFIT